MLLLENIKKCFPENVEPILNGIDFSLSRGEFCIIIGSNGSGKSTLLKSISGEQSIDFGHIKIDKKDVTLCNRTQWIASVTQDINRGTVPELTLLENLILSLSRGKSVKLNFYQKKRKYVLSIVESLGMNLEHYIDLPLKLLSGGQRQVIALLMAISSNPDILLLDEHTSALDPKTQKIIMDYTANSIRKESMTTMMITHKLEEAITYGNRLIMLHKGKVVLDFKENEKKNLNTEDLLMLFQKKEEEIKYV